jgi:hypothetical protein
MIAREVRFIPLASLVWFALAAPALAQSSPAAGQASAGPRPGAPAPVSVSPNPTEFVVAAIRAIGAIDQGAAGALWDNASSAMKGLETRDVFTQTAAARTAVDGEVRNLQWASLNRIHAPAPQGKLPAGDYVTVGLIGVNKAQKVVFEEVSFVLDKDSVWRLVGISER